MVRWLVIIGLLTGFWTKGAELGQHSKPLGTPDVHVMDGADPFPH